MEATNLEWELLAADRSSSPSSSGCRRLSAAATHRRRHTAACLPAAAVESAGSPAGSRQKAAGGWRRHCRPRRHSLDADEAPPLAAATHRRHAPPKRAPRAVEFARRLSAGTCSRLHTLLPRPRRPQHPRGRLQLPAPVAAGTSSEWCVAASTTAMPCR